MPSRVVTVYEHGIGELVAEIQQAGNVQEEMIESELLKVIYRADPALEDQTGRLIQGRKNSEISLSVYLTEPDSVGISHVGGIRGKKEVFDSAIKELEEVGYEVKDGRV